MTRDAPRLTTRLGDVALDAPRTDLVRRVQVIGCDAVDAEIGLSC